jgi:hypothetical protein
MPFLAFLPSKVSINFVGLPPAGYFQIPTPLVALCAAWKGTAIYPSTTADDLARADSDLRGILATSQTLGSVDRQIYRTSAQELAVLTAEQRDEAARENAKPSLVFAVRFQIGNTQYSADKVHGVWIAPETTDRGVAVVVTLFNNGRAVARAPMLMVKSLDGLPIAGCSSVGVNWIRCYAPDVLRNAAVATTVYAERPPRAGVFRFQVYALTSTANGTGITFPLMLKIFIRPPLPQG